MCAYQEITNVSFSETFAYVLNGWPLSSTLALHLFFSEHSKEFFRFNRKIFMAELNGT